MNKKLYPETDIQNIANAIRALNGSTDTYTVSEMASAIALPENGYYLKQSASANPLTITDGQELNAQSCEVSFSPIQDLHGYQSPWIDSSEINNEPYLFRPVKNTATRIGNSLFDTLVGGTVAFNQLVDNGTSSVALTTNHKALTKVNGAWSVVNGGTIAVTGGTDMVIDLTQMFGSTIADYIYSLEQATAGSGVAYFRSLFPKDYYAYNAGQLMSVKALSHKMVGFNQWDEETELSGNQLMSKNYISVFPSTIYHFTMPSTLYSGQGLIVYLYNANKEPISAAPIRTMNYENYGANANLILTADTHYLKFKVGSSYGTTYNNDICINLHWDGERDGEYEAYSEHIYPLDSDLELRGIPKLDANNQLYYDGDTYESDGTVTRKMSEIDLGDYTWIYHEATGNMYCDTICTDRIVKSGFISICSKYQQKEGRITGLVGLTENGYYAFQDSVVGRIAIKDTNYTDATAFKTAMSGVKLIYELATPTTETADTFTNPQLVDNWGTEEYTDSREVQIPVGHESYQANICEISGRTAINVYQSATSTTTADTTYTTQFTGTVYGATGDMVSGNWEGEWGYIASYNGETLPAEWMSDRDAYVSGTTPTTGAEVAYVLATPTEIVTAPKTIPLSENTNNFWTDGDSVQVKYYSKSL